MDIKDPFEDIKKSTEMFKKMAKKPDFSHLTKAPTFTTLKDISSEYFEGNNAKGFYKQLMTMIREFEDSLDDEHEVGAKLANFGQSTVIHISGMGYWNPHLIELYGHNENGEEIKLIQHTSQIDILLVKVKRANLSINKPRIGFVTHEDEADKTKE